MRRNIKYYTAERIIYANIKLCVVVMTQSLQ